MSEQKMTRRSFLSATAMAGAAMAVNWSRLDALAAQVNPKKAYPVVVIGAGLGGLCSAALLAGKGFPVTVVEQHSIPGGYATTFDRAGGKFTFDVSLHRMSADRELRQLFRELGIQDKIELVKIPDTTRVITPNRDVLSFRNLEQKAADLMVTYPHEKKGIEAYMAAMQTVLDELESLKIKGGGSNFPSQYPNLWKIRNKTCAEFIDAYVREPRIKKSFSFGTMGTFGLPPSRLSAFMYIMAKASDDNALCYVKRRSQDLSNALAESIEASGGQILYDTSVDRIDLKNAAVSGVITSRGTRLPAKIVVSNANAMTTFNRLLPANTLPADYINRINRYGTSLSSFVIWLGLNREIGDKIRDSHIAISSGRGAEASYRACLDGDLDNMDISVTLYDNFYKGYSDPGTSTVTIITGSGFKPWEKYASDYKAGRKAAYQNEKERWTRHLMKKVEEKAIPDLSAMVEVAESATPLTNWYYTRNPGGSIYGFDFSTDNAFMNRIKNRTPVTGLYLAGAWGYQGGGYSPALKGGEHTFRQVLEDWA